MPRDDLAVLQPGADRVDRGGALGIPACALVAHALIAHWLAGRLREQGREDGGITGIVAAIGTRTSSPDAAHLFSLEA